MNPPRCMRSGQSLVETALLLPVILLMLGGGYWFYRNLSLASSAECAAHSHMIRSGRGLPEIVRPLSESIHRHADAVRIGSAEEARERSVPIFPGLSGRTTATALVSVSREPVGAFLERADHAIRREAEASVNCWGKESRSGKSVRRIVRGIVLAGALR